MRYENENEFFQGIGEVIECYKKANKDYNKESWNIILSTYSTMVEDENKMCSIRNSKLNLQEKDVYEKMVQIQALLQYAHLQSGIFLSDTVLLLESGKEVFSILVLSYSVVHFFLLHHSDLAADIGYFHRNFHIVF